MKELQHQISFRTLGFTFLKLFLVMCLPYSLSVALLYPSFLSFELRYQLQADALFWSVIPGALVLFLPPLQTLGLVLLISFPSVFYNYCIATNPQKYGSSKFIFLVLLLALVPLSLLSSPPFIELFGLLNNENNETLSVLNYYARFFSYFLVVIPFLNHILNERILKSENPNTKVDTQSNLNWLIQKFKNFLTYGNLLAVSLPIPGGISALASRDLVFLYFLNSFLDYFVRLVYVELPEGIILKWISYYAAFPVVRYSHNWLTFISWFSYLAFFIEFKKYFSGETSKRRITLVFVVTYILTNPFLPFMLSPFGFIISLSITHFLALLILKFRPKQKPKPTPQQEERVSAEVSLPGPIEPLIKVPLRYRMISKIKKVLKRGSVQRNS